MSAETAGAGSSMHAMGMKQVIATYAMTLCLLLEVVGKYVLSFFIDCLCGNDALVMTKKDMSEALRKSMPLVILRLKSPSTIKPFATALITFAATSEDRYAVVCEGLVAGML